MKRTLWIIAILLGLAAIAAVACRWMCGGCPCHESEEEKEPENGDPEEEQQEGESEEIQEEEEANAPP